MTECGKDGPRVLTQARRARHRPRWRATCRMRSPTAFTGPATACSKLRTDPWAANSGSSNIRVAIQGSSSTVSGGDASLGERTAPLVNRCGHKVIAE